jgi:glucose-1-phosphate thymidylyltransferase
VTAIILAAGYATRLYPLTQTKAKPLLPVGGRPMIDYIVDHLRVVPQLERIVVVSNDKFYQAFEEWRKTHPGVPIKIVNDGSTNENIRLGAIRDTQFAVEQSGASGDVLVIGGDNLFDCDFKQFLGSAVRRAPAISVGLYDINDIAAASRFGIVELGKDGDIMSFEEKPDKPRSTLVATCIYYFPREKVGLFDKYLADGEHTDAIGHYIRWLCENDQVFGEVLGGKWVDIGDLETYNRVADSWK